MRLSGLLGRSDDLRPGDLSSPLIEARGDDASGVVTCYVFAEPISTPLAPGAEVQCVGQVVWRTDATEHRVSFDVINGAAISLAARSLRLSVRNQGNVPMRVSASISPMARAAAREAQLTTVGDLIPGGSAASFDVPAYAAWLEVWRERERATELEIDFAYPAPAGVLYNARAAAGERLPRMPVANGVRRVTVRNTGAGSPDQLAEATANQYRPILIWGLWL